MFEIASRFNAAIEIKYTDSQDCKVRKFDLHNIVTDFERNIKTSQFLSYLDDRLHITKRPLSNYSVASNSITTPSFTEYKLVDDIASRIADEFIQIKHFDGKKIIILEMSHYNNMAEHYLENFSLDIGGYNEVALSLFNRLPQELDYVLFWFISINSITPRFLFMGDMKTKKIFNIIDTRQIKDLMI